MYAFILRTVWLICILPFFSNHSYSQNIKKQPELVYYVSQSGNDHFSGLWSESVSFGSDGPFKTLERARDFIRIEKEGNLHPDGGVKIVLREGVYFVDDPIIFSPPDTGTPVSPVTITAYKDEKVVLTGGIELKPSWFTSVRNEKTLSRLNEKVRVTVLQADLKEHGITDYGELNPRSNWRNESYPSAMEIFYKGTPMKLARYPDNSWLKIASTAPDNATGTFYYMGDRPKSWESPSEILLHGYWKHNWSDSFEKLASIDVENRELKTLPTHSPYGYSAGSRFYFSNILEEMDRPGEYYIDRENGILYMIPPGPIEPGDVYASMSNTPLMILSGVSSFTISNITFENSRGDGLVILNGTMNVIAGCVVKNMGGVGIRIEGGKDNGALSNDIFNTGAGALRIEGGNRKTLTPSRNFARNNHIYKYGRILRTASPGIYANGVGLRISWNKIHNAPHEAISFHGNDNIIERNEIYDVAWETSDAGAVYIGRNWTERGNVIRNNFFHHIQSMYGYGTALDGNGANAVYLDDMASGTTVTGNVFYKAGRCVLIGGGRNNIISNNAFIDCAPAAIHIDSRGTGWAANSVKEDGVMMKRLKEIDYKNEPYSVRYPSLKTILDEYPAEPRGNIIKFNIVTDSNFLELINTDKSILDFYDNLVDSEPGYNNLKTFNFSIFDDSLVYDLGFAKIPFSDIGLKTDEYRKTLPTEDNSFLERNRKHGK